MTLAFPVRLWYNEGIPVCRKGECAVDVLQTLVLLVPACSVPVIAFALWRKRTGASFLPLLVSIPAYIFISWMRGIARVFVLNDSIRETPWLFYLLSALLSGLFEEVGRCIVFRYVLRNHTMWRDCVSYGIGHITAETFLISRFPADFIDALISAWVFAGDILVSAALSVLVFACVHYAADKRLLLLAIGLHTQMDFFGAFYWLGLVDVSGIAFLHLFWALTFSLLAYRVFRYYTPSEE